MEPPVATGPSEAGNQNAGGPVRASIACPEASSPAADYIPTPSKGTRTSVLSQLSTMWTPPSASSKAIVN